MHTIRQTNGLSGFTKRSESEFDCFGTGHSSTTISAGLGTSLFCSRYVRMHQVQFKNTKIRRLSLTELDMFRFVAVFILSLDCVCCLEKFQKTLLAVAFTA